MRWSEFIDIYKKSIRAVFYWEIGEREQILQDTNALLKTEGITPQEAADRFLDFILSDIHYISYKWKHTTCSYPFLGVPVYSHPEHPYYPHRHQEHVIEIILRELMSKGAVLAAEKLLSPNYQSPPIDINADLETFRASLDGYSIRGFLIDIFGITNDISGLYDIEWNIYEGRSASSIYSIKWNAEESEENAEAQHTYFFKWLFPDYEPIVRYYYTCVLLGKIKFDRPPELYNKYIHYSALKGESHFLSHKFPRNKLMTPIFSVIE